MLKRRFPYSIGVCFGAALALLSSSPVWSAGDAIDSKKPNFLFIAIDDLNVFNTPMGQSPDSFLHKVYPDDSVRQSVVDRLTPNLNRLAQQALTFDRAYTASPLCGPSRTALMTGVPAHVSGYYAHDKHFRLYDTLENVVTLPQYLKSQGYYTAGAGKVFHKGRTEKHNGHLSEWADQTYSWSDWIEVHSGTGGEPPKGHRRKVEVSKYWPPGGKSFTKFGTHNIPTEHSNDYLNSEFAAKLVLNGSATLKSHKGKHQTTTLPANQPWFVGVGIFAPHMPWIVEQQYLDMFPQEEMAIDRELLTWVRDGLGQLSPTGQRITRNTRFSKLTEHGLTLDPKNGDVAAWKAMFQAYLASTAFADKSIGVLLDAIENNPEKDNTVVVLWSDHGYHVGDKNRKGKTTLWEASTHSNLIILDPRIPASTKGHRTLSGVSLQDVYPTIVALAGLKRPEHLYGYDLSPVLMAPEKDWRKPVLSTYQKGNHAIRVGDYRYIRFKNGDEELYQLKDDPFEENNLAQRPKYRKQLALFSKQLDAQLNRQPNQF
ncbi:sulfatase [Echinimonas agarilytica]|uniref:Sulfatase n=1 Tax=Echinimonas agarilytica TaxID=1215918 RepID=A0AA42B8N3_9GAMM|nr:sulfatase [Echinimonas agarilytica]MCM2680411.1 sulfatase [Echinimonas agarilytica]